MPLGQLPFPTPGWRDLLEILIVAYVIYALLRFLVGTRALQIVFGLLVLTVIYLVAFLLKLSMITYLLGVAFTYGDKTEKLPQVTAPRNRLRDGPTSTGRPSVCKASS